jgi:signal transduction histidine kinase
LREVVSIKDRFISLIAHDLKNLMSSQYVLSNMLAQRHMELTEEKRDEFLKLIDDGAYRPLKF